MSSGRIAGQRVASSGSVCITRFASQTPQLDERAASRRSVWCTSTLDRTRRGVELVGQPPDVEHTVGTLIVRVSLRQRDSPVDDNGTVPVSGAAVERGHFATILG